jgi:hypothetical protein
MLQSKTDIFGEPKVDTCFEVVEQMRGFRQIAEIVVRVKIEIIKAESGMPRRTR